MPPKNAKKKKAQEAAAKRTKKMGKGKIQIALMSLLEGEVGSRLFQMGLSGMRGGTRYESRFGPHSSRCSSDT